MTRKLTALFLALTLLFTCVSVLAEEPVASRLPLVDEPTTLWFVGIRDAGYEDGFANVPALQRWQEETGITIKWDTYTAEAWAEQRNLILSSGGEMPDAFAGGNPISDADLQTWAADGVLMPLRELSAQYMPRFQQIMAQHPEYYKSFVDETGEFYAFPTHFDIDFGNRGSVLYMSRSVLAQVGEYTYTDHEYFSTIDKAFTTDELYELLRAIKDKTSAIPLSVSSIDDLQPFFWAFGCNESTDLIYVEDGQVKTFLEDDSFIQACDYLHRLYAEGLLDQEVATQSYDQYRTKLMTEGAVGVTNMWSGLIAVSDYTNMEDPRYSDWAGCVPLIGPDGTQQYRKGASGVAIKGSLGILSTSRNAEQVCKFMDYLYNEDNSYQLSYGDYGSGLIPEADGTITQNFADAGQSGKFLNTMFITTAEMNSRINYAPATAMAIEVGALLAKPYHANWSFPSMSTPERYIERLAELSTDLSTYYKRVRAELITEGGAAERIDEIRAEMNNIGLQEYIQIRQAMLDIYNAG